MRHELENDTLKLYFEGELNSSNSEEVEQEIDSYTSQGGFKSVILDFEKLNYISSAGLRIIIRLKQRFDDTRIIKVSDSVYEIFDMVGFNNVLTIERQ